MNRIIVFLCFSLLLFTSCYQDADDDLTVEGVWKLTAYNVADGFDLNNDGLANVNLLDELSCSNNETLVFQSNGIVTSNQTFNPAIQISLVMGTPDTYFFNVSCDDVGIIGLAAQFTLKGRLILIDDRPATLAGNTLTRIFNDALKVYNQDFTQVVATKDITLVYTKQ